MTPTPSEIAALIEQLQRLLLVPSKKAVRYSSDCGRVGVTDPVTGAVECSIEAGGGDCLCADRHEFADEIVAAMALDIVPLQHAIETLARERDDARAALDRADQTAADCLSAAAQDWTRTVNYLSTRISTLAADNACLRAALEEIAEMHLGDCPAAQDETSFAQGYSLRLRKVARAALKEGSQP